MKQYSNYVYDILLKLGFKANLPGTSYFKDLIINFMIYENEPVMKNRFKIIATNSNVKYSQVERALRYAVDTSWKTIYTILYEYFPDLEEDKKSDYTRLAHTLIHLLKNPDLLERVISI